MDKRRALLAHETRIAPLRAEAIEFAEVITAYRLQHCDAVTDERLASQEAQCGEEVCWGDNDNLEVLVRAWFEGCSIILPPNAELVKALVCRIHCRAVMESGGHA